MVEKSSTERLSSVALPSQAFLLSSTCTAGGDSRARELAEQLGAATFDESFDEDATDLPFAQFKRGGKLEGRSE